MKHLIFLNKIIALIFLLNLLFCINSSAQKKKLPAPKKFEQISDADTLEGYQDWKRVRVEKGYSFYLPKDFKLEEKQGIDFIGWYYQNSDFKFVVMVGPYAPIPSAVGRNIQNYRRGSIKIDGINSILGSYRNIEDEYQYTIGINFKPPETMVISVAVFLDSKTEEGYELGLKIFKSIRFDKVEKTNKVEKAKP